MVMKPELKEFIRITKKLERLCNRVFQHYGNCENCDYVLCCKVLSCIIEKNETNRIANFLKIKNDDFIKKYLVDISIKNPVGGKDIRYMINDIPCPFLENDKCKIYPVRPMSCRCYPFQPSMPVVLEGVELCPTSTFIGSDVFDFVQQMREKKGMSQPSKKTTPLAKQPISRTVLDPIEQKGIEMGINDIVMQGYEDNYPLQVFLDFLKFKKII